MTLPLAASRTSADAAHPARLPWLLWLLFTGITLFALWVAWDQGLLARLLATDRSRLSVAIGLIYLAASALAARRLWYLSVELEKVQCVERRLRQGTGPGPLPDGFLHDYLGDLRRARSGSQETARGEPLVELYAARARGPLDSGWFMADVMLKLGLLGTIVGFILMLGSVAQTTSLDANTMQKVLRQMSIGMGTALYTTLAGLAGSVLASVQLQIAERATDELVERAVHIGELTAER